MKLTTAAEVASKEPWRFLIFGEPGIGKTTLCAQAPNPVIIACPHNEVLSLAKTDQALVPVIPVGSWSGAVEAVDYAKKIKEVDTIIFDTWSHLYEFAVQEATQITRGKVSEATWTNANGLMRDLSNSLLTARGKNVIIIAHQRLLKDSDGNIVKTTADFGEGYLRKFVARLNAAFYYRQVGNGRELATAAVPGVETKNRYDLPTRFRDPSLNDVVSAIDAYREKARKLHESQGDSSTNSGS